MDRAKLDRWCERGILGLVLGVLFFSPMALGAVRPTEFLVVQGLVAGATALWAVRLWLDPRFHLWWPPICWAVAAFVLYAVFRYFGAEIEYIARQELVRVLVYAFLFLVIINNLNRQEYSQAITFGLILLAVGLSVYALFQLVTGSDKVWHFARPAQYAGRAGGTFINPNHLAAFLAMILPLAMACTVIGRLGHATKIVMGYGALVILIGIGVTMSRGGWIATLLSLAVFFGVLMLRRNFRLRAALMLGILGLATAGLLTKTADWQKRFEDALHEDQLRDARPLLWKPAVRIWQDHPLWGAGPGHYDALFRQYRPAGVQARPVYVHNDYLQALTDWGLAGTLLIGLAFGLLAWGIFKTWPHVQRAPNDLGTRLSNKAAFVLGASTGLLAVLLHSIVEFNFQIPSNAILAVTLMALMSGYLRYATERFWFTPRAGIKLLLTLVLLAGAACLGWQSQRVAAEQTALRAADRQPQYSTEQIDALKHAYSIEPMNFETTRKLGEIYRMRSWAGLEGYRELAEEAMTWFARAIELHPYDPYPVLRYGMCLVWLDRPDEAAQYFERALALDPNSYYTVAHRGWYAFQIGRHDEAKQWFEHSQRLRRNPTAADYLEILQEMENRR